MSTLLFRLTTEENWKNVKRRISTSTLLENWRKKNGTWKWRLYQLRLVRWHCNKIIIKGTGGFGSWRTNGGHPNDSIIEDGQNAEKSPGDLRRLAVTQISMKNNQLTLMWKTIKEYIIIIIILIIIIWRCLWCNGYRRRKWTRWHEFKFT